MMEKKIARLRQHCIICGFGRVGSRIAREFTAAHTPFVVVDEKEAVVQRCIQQGYLVLQGDAALLAGSPQHIASFARRDGQHLLSGL